MRLADFMLMVLLIPPENFRQPLMTTYGFLMFLGGLERDKCHEIGYDDY